MTKKVLVAGTAMINWTCMMPQDLARDAVMCDDPAIEAVLGAISPCQVYVWGEEHEPVDVHLEIDEQDVEIEDDDRQAE